MTALCQSPPEKLAETLYLQLRSVGLDPERVLHTNDLVKGDDVFVAATGVTTGALLRGVQYTDAGAETDSIVMRSCSGTIRRVSAYHALE